VKQLDRSNRFQTISIKGNCPSFRRLAVVDDGEQQCWFFFGAILVELLGRLRSLVDLPPPLDSPSSSIWYRFGSPS
jgi:hypothetical protein